MIDTNYFTKYVWRVIPVAEGFAVCKFSNERLRIDAEGNVGIGGWGFGGATPTTTEGSLETHLMKTFEWAHQLCKLFTNLQKIEDNFGVTPIHLSTSVGQITHSGYHFYTPPQSDWECELFGCGRNIVLKPSIDKVPNRFWRWMQFLAFGNKWIKDKK